VTASGMFRRSAGLRIAIDRLTPAVALRNPGAVWGSQLELDSDVETSSSGDSLSLQLVVASVPFPRSATNGKCFFLCCPQLTGVCPSTVLVRSAE
jgi:hypothetical protein